MNYTPDKGDVVWLVFDPQSGHEQKGRRPAVILTNKLYNKKTSLALACPITSKIKGYPFEVRVLGKINGVVLSDQVRCIDWKSRKAKFIEAIDQGALLTIIENIELLLSE